MTQSGLLLLTTGMMERGDVEQESPLPVDLPPRPTRGATTGSRRELCLRERFFTISMSSYDIIHTHDGQIWLRHIVMVAILLLRAAMSALCIFSALMQRNVAAIALYGLLTFLSFWFTATCLAVIGDAAGDRGVSGVIIKRWHFDAFLGFCLLVHALLITLFFFGLGGMGLGLTGIALWLLILGVAWIAGWEPSVKNPTNRRNWYMQVPTVTHPHSNK
ncbi:hypothetical protein Q7P37_009744 [Cladosporium fusiforme]